MKQFKIGTVVKLRGGSPPMTVAYNQPSPHGLPQIGTAWVDTTGKPQYLNLPPEAFVVVRRRAAKR